MVSTQYTLIGHYKSSVLTTKSPVVERTMFRLLLAWGVTVKAPVEVNAPPERFNVPAISLVDPLTSKLPAMVRFPPEDMVLLEEKN